MLGALRCCVVCPKRLAATLFERLGSKVRLIVHQLPCASSDCSSLACRFAGLPSYGYCSAKERRLLALLFLGKHGPSWSVQAPACTATHCHRMGAADSNLTLGAWLQASIRLTQSKSIPSERTRTGEVPGPEFPLPVGPGSVRLLGRQRISSGLSGLLCPRPGP